MGKKTETRKEKLERLRREAENRPSAVRLRELAARAEAELKARREAEGRAES